MYAVCKGLISEFGSYAVDMCWGGGLIQEVRFYISIGLLNKFSSVFNTSVHLLMINFFITLSKCCDKKPKLMFKRREEIQDAIATKHELHQLQV